MFPQDPPSGSSRHPQDPSHHLYVTSHGAYAAGEQRHRHYDWDRTGLDPASHSFGEGLQAALHVILGILLCCMCPCLRAFAMLVFGCDSHGRLHSFWKGALDPLQSQSTPFLAFCSTHCPLTVLGILLHADCALCCLLTVRTVWAFCFLHVPFLRSVS